MTNEAVEDRKSGEYESSLAKHVWFHENVLKYDESFYGVRLSYALSEWHELANIYPEAMERIIYYSDLAEATVKEGRGCCYNSFHEFVSINTELNRTELIVDLFRWLNSNNKKLAIKVYDLAQPALILSEEYELCGEYIQPEKRFRILKELYEQNLELSKSPRFGEDLKEFGIKSFTNEVATLVALLYINGRQEEAEEIANLGRNVLNQTEFNRSVDQALVGVIPKPWP